MAPALLLAAGCGPAEVEEDLCENVTCGVNAQCSEGACVCDPGFSGDADVKCEADDACKDVICGFNATCTAGACQCDAGYEGDADEGCVKTAKCTETSCGGNGECSVENNAIVCACDDNYVGDTCAECATGFTKEGGVCVAEDLCANVECGDHGSCVVEADVASCECAAQWAGDACDQCAEDYADVEGACVNTQTVDCDAESETAPDNATYDTTGQVEITYTTAGDWTAPAVCEWTCNDTFVTSEDGESCVPEPTITACELVEPSTIAGRSDESFDIRGSVTVEDGPIALASAEVCYTNAEMTEPVCAPSDYDAGDEFVASVTFPAGTYDYLYRFSVNGGNTWVDCGLGGDAEAPGVATISQTPNDQLQAVRDAADTSVTLPVENVFVTTVVDFGDGVTRFFVQASKNGPAVYVEVPAAPDVEPAVGHEMSFTVTEVTTLASGIVAATEISAVGFVSTGNDLSAWTQDLTEATDLVAGLDGYESERVELVGVLTGMPVDTEDGFWTAAFTTTPAGEEIEIRLSDMLYGALVADGLDPVEVVLANECEMAFRGVMWRNGSTPQPTFIAPGLDLLEPLDAACAKYFAVAEAESTSNTEVEVTFNQRVDSGTVDATKFTFDPALEVLDAVVSGSGDSVILTTASQSAGTYTLTVGDVLDEDGRGLKTNRTTALFAGTCVDASPVVISQIFASGGLSDAAFTDDFVELFNRSGEEVSIDGWSLQLQNEKASQNWKMAELAGVIAPGGYLLVKLAGGATGEPLPEPHYTGDPGLNLTKSGGRLALMTNSVLLDKEVCPAWLPETADYYGFGKEADNDCVRGSLGPNTSSNAIAFIRTDVCSVPGDNGLDFEQISDATSTIVPRTSDSPAGEICANVCGTP